MGDSEIATWRFTGNWIYTDHTGLKSLSGSIHCCRRQIYTDHAGLKSLPGSVKFCGETDLPRYIGI